MRRHDHVVTFFRAAVRHGCGRCPARAFRACGRCLRCLRRPPRLWGQYVRVHKRSRPERGRSMPSRDPGNARAPRPWCHPGGSHARIQALSCRNWRKGSGLARTSRASTTPPLPQGRNACPRQGKARAAALGASPLFVRRRGCAIQWSGSIESVMHASCFRRVCCMKKIMLLALGSLLLAGASFAEDKPGTEQKDTSDKKQSIYKSSPRLSYHSRETEGHPELEKLKPMLNQMGNNPTGIVTPGGAGMSF